MNKGILMHEIGHAVVLMSQNPNIEVGYIRPASDNPDETELLYNADAPSGVEDTVFACAFAFCETNPELACKMLPQSSEAVAAMFKMIVAADEPELWAATLHASDADINTLRDADVSDRLWHSALVEGCLLVKTEGHAERLEAMVEEYKDKGLLTLTRDDVAGMFNR